MKKNKIFGILLFCASLISCFLQYGCKKDDSNKVAVQLYLTDAPAPFDSVFINLQSLEFIKEGAEGGDVLNFNRQGLYNILKFTNGKDTLLGTIELTPGVLSKVKLTISGDNSVIIAGRKRGLTNYRPNVTNFTALFSDSIKLKNNYRYWLDIDIARSVIFYSSSYYLNPVFRIYSEENTGSIKGEITPISARPFVQAISANDTVGTIAGTDGKFLIRGVPEGAYSVTARPQNGMDSLTIDSIKVIVGKTTDAGRFLIY